MKSQAQQSPKKHTRTDQARIVSEHIDKVQDDLTKALWVSENDATTKVKLARSRRETRITFVFRGSLEETEGRMEKIYTALTGKKVETEIPEE